MGHLLFRRHAQYVTRIYSNTGRFAAALECLSSIWVYNH